MSEYPSNPVVSENTNFHKFRIMSRLCDVSKIDLIFEGIFMILDAFQKVQACFSHPIYKGIFRSSRFF